MVVAAVVIGVVIGASLERTNSNSNASSTQSQTPATRAPGHLNPQHGNRDEGVGADAQRPFKDARPARLLDRASTGLHVRADPRTNAQRIYLRYLPAGVALGSPGPTTCGSARARFTVPQPRCIRVPPNRAESA